jgi:hypothetical protein
LRNSWVKLQASSVTTEACEPKISLMRMNNVKH